MKSGLPLTALAAFCLTLCLAGAQAAPLRYEPKKLTLEVPVGLQGVLSDPSAKNRRDSIRYEIVGQLYSRDESATLDTKDPVELQPTNAWAMVRKYLKIIVSGKPSELEPLMSAEAWSSFSKVSPESFAARSATLKKMKSFTPIFALDYKGAVLLHWLTPEGKLDLLPLRRKADGSYQIHPFHAGQDPTLGNIFQYAFHRPEPPLTPQLTEKFSTWSSKQKTVILESQLSRPGNSIILYRDHPTDPRGEPKLLGIARDNSKEEGFLRFADSEEKPARLKIKIKTSELRSEEPYQLHALELNYPPAGVPKLGRASAQSWLITPPKDP